MNRFVMSLDERIKIENGKVIIPREVIEDGTYERIELSKDAFDLVRVRLKSSHSQAYKEINKGIGSLYSPQTIYTPENLDRTFESFVNIVIGNWQNLYIDEQESLRKEIPWEAGYYRDLVKNYRVKNPKFGEDGEKIRDLILEVTSKSERTLSQYL